MKKLLLIFGLIIVSFSLSAQALSTFQQELLDGSIAFLDTLRNQFIEQPSEIDGLYLKLPSGWWSSLWYDSSLPGDYALTLSEGDGTHYLQWGSGEQQNIDDANGDGELRLPDGLGGNVIAVLYDIDAIHSSITPIAENLTVNYIDEEQAEDLMHDLTTVRLELSEIDTESEYLDQSVALWNMYIGSQYPDAIESLEEVYSYSGSSDQLYKDEQFTSFVEGLAGVYKFVNLSGSISGLLSESALYTYTLGESLPMALEFLDLTPQSVLLNFIQEYVLFIGSAFQGWTQAMDSDNIGSNGNWTPYGRYIFNLSGAPQPDGIVNGYEFTVFNNLYPLDGEEVPGYTCPFGGWDWQDQPLIPGEINLLSFMVYANNSVQNGGAWFSLYKGHVKLSILDGEFNTIATEILTSAEKNVTVAGCTNPFFKTRYDVGVFIPESLDVHDCYLQVDWYGRTFLFNEEYFVGSFFMPFDFDGNAPPGIEVPSMPQGLVAQLESGSATLSWDANPAGDNIDHYNLYKSNSSGFTLSSSTLLANVSELEFTDTGIEAQSEYFYRLIAVNQDGVSSNPTSEISIATNGPQAAFSTNETFGEIPFSVTFQDKSSSYDPITEWAWDFDNDGTFDSYEQSPSTIYNQPGIYTVRLQVTDGTFVSSSIEEEMIVVYDPDSNGLLAAAGINTAQFVNVDDTLKTSLGGITSVYSVAMDIVYNPDQIEITNITEGSALSENGSVATAFQYDHDENEGRIIVGVTRLNGNPVNLISLSDVCNVDFVPVAFGSSSIQYQNVGLFNENGELLNQPMLMNSEISVEGEDQTIFVIPDQWGYELDIFEETELSLFIPEGNQMQALSADIIYDPDVIEILNVTEGPLFNEDGQAQTAFLSNIDNEEGIVSIGVARLGNPAMPVSISDSTNVCTIIFRSINYGSSEMNVQNAAVFSPVPSSPYETYSMDSYVIVPQTNGIPYVAVQPDTVDVMALEDFTVDIYLENMNDLWATSFDVQYDPMILRLDSISEGTLLNENGTVQTAMISDIDNQQGNATFGITRLVSPPSGIDIASGIVTTLHFYALRDGSSEIIIDNIGLIQPTGDLLPFVAETTAHVDAELPTDITLITISPDSLDVTAGESFVFDFSIQDATNIYAYAFDVLYDSEMLQVVNVTEGGFLNENETVNTTFMYTDQPANDRLVIGNTRTNINDQGASTVTQDGLFSVEFQAIGAGSCIISLDNAGLMHPDGSFVDDFVMYSTQINCLSLEPPQNVQIECTETEVTISWDVIPDVDGYRVYSGVSPDITTFIDVSDQGTFQQTADRYFWTASMPENASFWFVTSRM